MLSVSKGMPECNMFYKRCNRVHQRSSERVVHTEQSGLDGGSADKRQGV